MFISQKSLIRFQAFCWLIVFVLLGLGCAVHRGMVHEIEEGQTLWRISQVYEVELDTLLKVNNIENPSSVRAGTEIIVPGANRRRDVPSTPRRTAQSTGDSNSTGESSGNDTAGSNSSQPSGTEESVQDSSPSSSESRSKNTSGSSSSGANSESSSGEVPTRYFDPVWPCEGRLASRFEKNGGPAERGIRIHTSEGSLVKAAEEGNIKLAGSWDKMPELGKIVIIFHSNDFTTVYAHLESLRVSEGETVNRGQPIGTVGKTGAVDRSMCYFEVRYELEPRDPLIFLGEST